jgi:hypothetical protein
MISLLVPTRKRPEKLRRMIDSVHATALNDVEILCYVTPDDSSYKEHVWPIGPISFITGPRLIMSDLWNALLPHAHGDILQQTADDVVYRTPQWDRYIEEAFAEVPDRILLVHGHDGHWNGENFGTLPFVHRRWAETLGYFTGPGFSVDFSDTWPNDVANLIGRRKYLPLYFEHLHWIWGKSEMDETYQEIQDVRLQEGMAITALYNERLPERIADAEKLRAVMR